MAFTLVLPRLMLHDVTAAASGDAEEEEEGGVLDLVSQQLAPPFLVQQSSTLFRRMNTGTLGVPLVDANMRELAATGFMSNRGRQNVASYLCLDLQIDWRYGADHFESLLLDYDVCSNWGV